MSTFKEIAFLFDGQQINLTEYLPYSGRFRVPAFTASTTSSSVDIVVPIIERTDANYNIFFKQQSYVGKTTEVWLTFQIVTKTPSSFTVRAYNEQRVDIDPCEAAYLILPNITVEQ